MFVLPKGKVEVLVECGIVPVNPSVVITDKAGNVYNMSVMPSQQLPLFGAVVPLYVDHKYSKYKIEVFNNGVSLGTAKVKLLKVARRGGLEIGLIPSETKIRIRANVSSLPQRYVTLGAECKDLDKMDLFGKSDPYIEILRKSPAGPWVRVFKSKYIKKTLNPEWDDLTLPYDYLCSKPEHLIQPPDQNDTELLIRVWDFDTVSNDDLIGEVTVKFNELFLKPYPLLRKKKYKKKKNSGVIKFTKFSMQETKGYVDYFVLGDHEITCSFFIDFGGKRSRTSYPEDWTKTIKAVAKSFRRNLGMKSHITAYMFNHEGSKSQLHHLGKKEKLGRKEIVEEFKDKINIGSLPEYIPPETERERRMRQQHPHRHYHHQEQYTTKFANAIKKGASLYSEKNYHVSVYFTDSLFRGNDDGRGTLSRVNERPIPWSAVFVYPPRSGAGSNFQHVGGNSYVKAPLVKKYSARKNTIAKLGREYDGNYSDLAADIFSEVIIQAITYYEFDSKMD